MQKLRLHILLVIGLSVNLILGFKYDLISVLPSQLFEYLRETLGKHALEHPEAARSEKQWNKCFFPMETPGYY